VTQQKETSHQKTNHKTTAMNTRAKKIIFPF